MNPGVYVSIGMLFVIIFITKQNEKRLFIKQFIKSRKKEESAEMIEAAKSFIGKDCIIYTFNSQQLIGKVKDVSGGAVIIETNGSTEAVNADFIVRLREHPVNKKGKKKSVVLD